jgi:hypothetical protein
MLAWSSSSQSIDIFWNARASVPSITPLTTSSVSAAWYAVFIWSKTETGATYMSRSTSEPRRETGIVIWFDHRIRAATSGCCSFSDRKTASVSTSVSLRTWTPLLSTRSSFDPWDIHALPSSRPDLDSQCRHSVDGLTAGCRSQGAQLGDGAVPMTDATDRLVVALANTVPDLGT